MATIKQFEDLQVWQQARVMCTLIQAVCFRTTFKKDFELVRQVNKSSGSCKDNIAEGFERDGNREFIFFLFQKVRLVRLVHLFIAHLTAYMRMNLSLKK